MLPYLTDQAFDVGQSFRAAAKCGRTRALTPAISKPPEEVTFRLGQAQWSQRAELIGLA